MESQRTEVERNKQSAEELSDDLNESAEVYENNVSSDDAQIDGTSAEQPMEEVKNEPVATVKESTLVNNSMNQSGKNYYVIGGAFGERSNAERFAEKLTAAGNQSSIIGQYDGLYLVAIDGFDSEGEATQAISKYSDITSKAWVFHKR